MVFSQLIAKKSHIEPPCMCSLSTIVLIYASDVTGLNIDFRMSPVERSTSTGRRAIGLNITRVLVRIIAYTAVHDPKKPFFICCNKFLFFTNYVWDVFLNSNLLESIERLYELGRKINLSHLASKLQIELRFPCINCHSPYNVLF